MLFLIAFLAGAALGWRTARLRGGDRLDRLQYAAVFGIIATLLALALLILVQRLALP